MKRNALKTIFATLLCVSALATPALAQMNGSFELCMGQSPQQYEGNRDHRGPDRTGHHWQEGRWERRGENNHDGPDRWTPGHWELDHRDNMMDRRDDNRRDDNRRDNNRHDDNRRYDNRGDGSHMDNNRMDNNRREELRRDSNQRDSQGDERKNDSRWGNGRS